MYKTTILKILLTTNFGKGGTRIGGWLGGVLSEWSEFIIPGHPPRDEYPPEYPLLDWKKDIKISA